jgi:hypothetical protein
VKFAQRHLLDAGMRLVKEDAAELHDAAGAHVDPVVPVAPTAHAKVIAQAIDVTLG